MPVPLPTHYEPEVSPDLPNVPWKVKSPQLKTTATKFQYLMCYWYKGRQIDPWNRREIKRTSCIYGKWYMTGIELYISEKRQAVTKWCWSNWLKKIQFYLIPFTNTYRRKYGRKSSLFQGKRISSTGKWKPPKNIKEKVYTFKIMSVAS